MKSILFEKGKEIHKELCEISDFIYHNPELGNEEYKAVEKLTSFLQEHNFEIETEFLGIKTAFRATYDSNKEGPTIGYLCEYDALPEIGHGCGHNMIGAMSAGAGVILSKVLNEIGGKIIVYGTPAEETNGAKVIFAEQGVFDELDVAMMVHPSDKTIESGTSMALYPLQFTYTGKTAHAASCPQDGINALNSVIQLFNGIDALRQHVTPDVRIHGIITNGGVAANIVPDKAIAQFYFRASTKEILDDILVKVKNIAQGAALMTGSKLEMTRYELPNDNLKTNKSLSEAFSKNLRKLGIKDIYESKDTGSSDIGNVSHKTPTIHPYIGISNFNVTGHSVNMADATITPFAHERLLIGALALAYTGYDVLIKKVDLKG
ncbi:amidohydrolase family protein [[Clostridium] bifermentans ATCC 638]|uniref:Peptidase M20 domain-containing protein 2 n=1 Tax=Paraclostridium bifermentans ATCC 638 = DSM 14991 TaxID=1233171 RepID=T4VR80_PARBF|nr:M20 family metallopeptidase [Paraclostridium bifermentans]EQK43187.1 amidohydrolase family protein [[Clostridium] bifermentans ATCC 638] [Paraclostridium bifermentans ATCC 638 = DSM 14991]RIZ60412.1 amidohydrolase [Paraclostridium bifermentans]UAG17054.1 M20 family metallopeptidase [Paraclostridium bifermentans]